MEIGDWITLAAVIVALGIGVASILHTQSLQKKDRKERYLDNIIEWAIDVSKCGIEKNLDSWRNITARYFDKTNYSEENLLRELESERFTDISELVGSFSIIKPQSHYISNISLAFGHDLQNAILMLKDSIEEHIKLLDSWQKLFIEPEKEKISEENNPKQANLNVIGDLIISHKEQLRSLAYKVMEEATKIKTRDIR